MILLEGRVARATTARVARAPTGVVAVKVVGEMTVLATLVVTGLVVKGVGVRVVTMGERVASVREEMIPRTTTVVGVRGMHLIPRPMVARAVLTGVILMELHVTVVRAMSMAVREAHQTRMEVVRVDLRGQPPVVVTTTVKAVMVVVKGVVPLAMLTVKAAREDSLPVVKEGMGVVGVARVKVKEEAGLLVVVEEEVGTLVLRTPPSLKAAAAVLHRTVADRGVATPRLGEVKEGKAGTVTERQRIGD